MIFNLCMKKLLTLCSFLFMGLFLFLLESTQTSCSKNTTCTVDIYVVDTTGHKGVQTPVPGASVKLYANINPPGQVQATGTTDGSGHVHFSFKLPAIFDVLATQGSMTGSGLVQLQVGGNVSQTILIK